MSDSGINEGLLSVSEDWGISPLLEAPPSPLMFVAEECEDNVPRRSSCASSTCRQFLAAAASAAETAVHTPPSRQGHGSPVQEVVFPHASLAEGADDTEGAETSFRYTDESEDAAEVEQPNFEPDADRVRSIDGKEASKEETDEEEPEFISVAARVRLIERKETARIRSNDAEITTRR